jgi:hypothetical protein
MEALPTACFISAIRSGQIIPRAFIGSDRRDGLVGGDGLQLRSSQKPEVVAPRTRSGRTG